MADAPPGVSFDKNGGEINLLIEISTITIGPDRREALPENVRKVAESIAEVGLLSPITIDKWHTLIAGLHRLEAAKSLGWTRIECYVTDLEGLQAELAEIDENVIRNELDDIDLGKMLMRRKEIYEALHPTTKQGGDRKSEDFKTSPARFDSAKPFSVDTSEKTGISRRTVEQKMQIARDLVPEVQKIVKQNQIGFKNALKLSRLEPEQQKEAATLLAGGKIRKIDEYTTAQSKADQTEVEPDAPPFRIGDKQFSTFAEGVADLKNTAKDFSCTPDDFLAEVTAFARKFQQEIEWYGTLYYEEVYPALSSEQLVYLRRQTDSIRAAAEQFYNNVTKGRK